jgi:hypothetical protein
MENKIKDWMKVPLQLLMPLKNFQKGLKEIKKVKMEMSKRIAT